MDSKQILFEKGKAEIIADILDGTLPETIDSFYNLDKFVDSNYYCGFTQNTYVHSEEFKLENEVQNMLDAWIKSPEFHKDIAEAKLLIEDF